MDMETADQLSDLRAMIARQDVKIAALADALDKSNVLISKQGEIIAANVQAVTETHSTISDLAREVSDALETVANLTGHPVLARVIDAVQEITSTYFRETFVKFFSEPAARDASAKASE